MPSLYTIVLMNVMPGRVDQLPITFTYTQAREAGLSKRALYALRDSGDVQAVGRGLYRWSDAPMVDLDLLEVAHRAPEATLCLISALARHDLTDFIPSEHDVALPRGRRHPAVAAPVHWHSFDPGTYLIGRDTTELDEQTRIGLYDAPRSVIDVFRLRGELGADVAYEGLRRWLRQGGHPADLLSTATAFPAALPVLRHAIDVLL